MIILLIGSGAREHALAHSLAQDSAVTELHAAPGNPGIGELATLHRVDPVSPDAVALLAAEVRADLVIVGPEAPLVAGVADAVRAAGIPVFGPSAAAAQLEGSKAFAKEIMAAANVPTAEPVVVRAAEDIPAALDRFGAPYVVKDDGLAAGKGVVVTEDRDAAFSHATAIVEAGGVVVVEEFLDGPEISLFCISDGAHVVPLAAAQDFKRAFNNDDGPNTGGMGAYSPLTWAPADLTDQVLQKVARPTIAQMAARGTPFVGVLYCGLALTSKGLRVVEFNARFGDPETQVVLARLKSSLADLLLAAARGELSDHDPLQWHDDAAVTVVIATGGYPGQLRAPGPITGVENANNLAGVHVLHAGTSLNAEGQLVSAGGRVLSVVGTGTTVAGARARAYAGVNEISLAGSHHRTDIAAQY